MEGSTRTGRRLPPGFWRARGGQGRLSRLRAGDPAFAERDLEAPARPNRRPGLDRGATVGRNRCKTSEQFFTGWARWRRRARPKSAEDGRDSVMQLVVLIEHGGAVKQTDAADGAPEDRVVMRRGGQGAHK
jgi:hypothetical protein